jgi:hypothetical protein
MQRQVIALSFFPLTEQDFTIRVYRRISLSSEKKPAQVDWSQRRLPVQNGTGDKYVNFWTSFEPTSGFEEFLCTPFTNVYLTIDFLSYLLRQNCFRKLSEDEFVIPDDGFKSKRTLFILQKFPEGKQVVWLEPYFLHSKRMFGFLVDFEFDAPSLTKANRRIQQLSLSLDKDFRSNKNFYADRFEKIKQFIATFYNKVFPLTADSLSITMQKAFLNLDADTLKVKEYVFANSYTSNSQFKGVKDYGPLREVTNNSKVYILYQESDRALAGDLFRALRGDTFSTTFPGMETIFHYALNKENVSGIPIRDFSPESLEIAFDFMKRDAGERPVVPIVIVPFSKDQGKSASRSYYTAKHTLLKHRIPSQFVCTTRMRTKEDLKWAISNIGLQLFAKMGGQPWMVSPHTHKCLIIGLGQAHRKSNGAIQKYFAYSVLTDSTGLYKDLRVLGQSPSPQTYIADFKKNLKGIFEKYYDQYNSFAVHTTFAIRREELDAVQDILEDLLSSTKDFVVIKFNDRNKYFGYSMSNNSLVPFESSFVRLSKTEFLVWFEGLQYHNPIVRKKIGRPLHVEFIYPQEGITDDRMKGYLQDAINLSGANWRGFNAKSLPISVYYAYLVASYYKEFQDLGLEEIDLEAIHPWFL